MFHCFTFFLVIRFCILRLSLNTPALCPLFHGVSPQGEEKFYQPFVWDNMVGSPPHRQGKAEQQAYEQLQSGITPAQAGKRRRVYPAGRAAQDHPRIGGEKDIPIMRAQRIWGSPPHRRGKGIKSLSFRWYSGITPAQAGKSRWSRGPGGCGSDHPRTGGEKIRQSIWYRTT